MDFSIFFKKTSISAFLLLSLLLSGCSNDDYPGHEDFVVAFENRSEDYSGSENLKNINIVFSTPAPGDGFIYLTYSSDDLVYGDSNDFNTNPELMEGIISVPVARGDDTVSFELHKHTEVQPGEQKGVEFEISEVSVDQAEAFTQGNTNLIVNFSETASMGGSLSPEVGGPNEPNQVYVDLASKTETAVRRDIWDLGFYSGDEFYVKLNSSLYMFAGALDQTNIDEVKASQVSDLQNQMNLLAEDSDQYVDHPNGSLDELAIKEISENEEENPVYLVKMGSEIGTDSPDAGSVAVAGESRGWKKIRVLRQGDDYLLQYADLDDTNHEEILIPKTPGYNFTFYSMVNQQMASVEPEQENWDLNFTVNLEIEDLPGTGSQTAYGFSDYISTNTLGNVSAYRVSTEDYTYNEFELTNFEESQLQLDQRVIGSSWRNTIPPDRGVLGDIFYVIKDSEGNLYKLKLTEMENQNGVRGYPKFKYELLQ